MAGGGNSEPSDTPTPRRVGRPWAPGQSGNPNGRPRIEPRVRRYARRYDRRMCQVLASIATDNTVPAAERRRAAMDLVAIGSGRPVTAQEVVGKVEQGPLVSLNLSRPETVSPSEAVAAYTRLMRGEVSCEEALAVLSAPPAPIPVVSEIRPALTVVASHSTTTNTTDDTPISPPAICAPISPTIETPNIPEVPAVVEIVPPPRPKTRDEQAAEARAENERRVELENARLRAAGEERMRRLRAEAATRGEVFEE